MLRPYGTDPRTTHRETRMSDREPIGLRIKITAAVVVLTVVPALIIGTLASRSIGRYHAAMTAEVAATRETLTRESHDAVRDLALRALEERARAVVQRLEAAPAIRPGDPALHKLAVEPISRSGYTMVYDAAGRVLFHPDESIEGGGLEFLTRDVPECAALLRRGVRAPASGSCLWRKDGRDAGTRLVVALPVPRYDLVVAAIAPEEEITPPVDRAVSAAAARLSQALQEPIDRAASRLRLEGLAILAVAAFLALLVGGRLAADIVGPIRELTDAARGLGAGNVRGIVGIGLRDEIGELTRAFVQMKRDVKLTREQVAQKQRELEAANREIRVLNQDLEHRILERTRELQAALEELRTLDKSKDDFIALVSHELRTPLTSIMACVDGLLVVGVGGSAPERARLLAIIHDEANRLSRLITDVLTLQRIEVGRMPFDFKKVNLVNLAEKACITIGMTAEAKGVRIAFTSSADPRLRAVRADYDRVVQVMTNLLSNAVKFTPSGGEVEATVDALAEGGREFARVSVRDTGVGIGDRDAKRIFDKFYQAELIDHHSEGSGLGLPIARSIVEEHGGRIGFEPAEGGGSIFRFLLPLGEG